MPYEQFDPSAPCHPLLPLNPIANKLTFFRINVFEAAVDVLKHHKDGKIDYDAYTKHAGLRVYRLGLPLTDLFPEIRERLKTKFVKDTVPQPVRLAVEGTYLPADKDYPSEPIVTTVGITDNDLKKEFFEIGRLKIKSKDIADELKSAGSVMFKDRDRLYRVQKAKKQAAGVSAAAPRRSAAFDFNITFPFDPAVLSDEAYYEVLGDLLFDPRSGMSDKGVDSANIDTTQMQDQHYGAMLISYRKDPRYNAYFTSNYPSARTAAGFAPLPSYEIGMYTTYEQTWELQGYSRGALIESITLAPKEEVSIEVFTFDRVKLEEERELSSEFEKNLEVTTFARASAEVSRDLTTTTDVNADVGVGIPLPIEGIPVKLDASGGVSEQVKDGVQQSLNHINEATVKSAERLKSKTRVKIVQTRESGREERTVRKIVNPNASRTLTLNYFELLETYRVTTVLKSTKQFCLLVETSSLGAIDVNFVLAYEDRLQKALLSPNYLAGFDAARKLAAQRWFDRRSELKPEIEQTNRQNGGGSMADAEVPEKPIVTIAKNLRKKLDKLLKVDLLAAAEVLSKHYDPFTGTDDKPSRQAVVNAEESLGLFNFWLKFKIATPGVEGKALEYVSSTEGSPSESALVGALGLFLTGMDDEWLTTVKMVALNLVSLQLASLVVIPFPLLAAVLYELALLDNNDGLPALIEKAKKELKTYEVANSVAIGPAAPGGATETAVVPQQPPPPQLFPLEELALANAEFEKLVLHIEANRTYYINKLLAFEDSNQRYERLKIKGIAPYVENRLLGFVGNKSVYPLKLKMLDQPTRARLENELAHFDVNRDESINGHQAPRVSNPPAETISLPTSAVYVESMLGRCEALEPYLMERRVIEQTIAQAQADLAIEKVNQQREENKRLAERIKQNLLDNPL